MANEFINNLFSFLKIFQKDQLMIGGRILLSLMNGIILGKLITGLIEGINEVLWNCK